MAELTVPGSAAVAPPRRPAGRGTIIAGLLCVLIGGLMLWLFAPGTPVHRHIAAHVARIAVRGIVTDPTVSMRCYSNGTPADADSPRCPGIAVRVSASNYPDVIPVGQVIDIGTTSRYHTGDGYAGVLPGTQAENVMDGFVVLGGFIAACGLAAFGSYYWDQRRVRLGTFPAAAAQGSAPDPGDP